MIGDGGFKAHGAGLGPKLGQALASGPTGLQRRVELARAREREKVEARRGPSGEASVVLAMVGIAALAESVGSGEQSGAERGTGGDLGRIEAGAGEFVDSVLPKAAPAVRAEVAGKVARAVRVRKSGPKGGRPREIEGEPWVEAGVSRRTWERRRKKEGGG